MRRVSMAGHRHRTSTPGAAREGGERPSIAGVAGGLAGGWGQGGDHAALARLGTVNARAAGVGGAAGRRLGSPERGMGRVPTLLRRVNKGDGERVRSGGRSSSGAGGLRTSMAGVVRRAVENS